MAPRRPLGVAQGLRVKGAGSPPLMPIRRCIVTKCPSPAEEGLSRCAVHEARFQKLRAAFVRECGAALQATSAYLAAHPGCERCSAPASIVRHRRPIRVGGLTIPTAEGLEGLCTSCDALEHAAPRREARP